MRKPAICFLLTVMLLTAGMKGRAYSAASGTGSIKVTILAETLGLTVSGDFNEINFNGLTTNQEVICAAGDRILVQNTGSLSIDVKVQLTNCTTSWTAGTTSTDNGADKYVLQGVFYVWNSSPSASDFGDNDCISATEATASATVFAVDSIDSDGDKGFNIISGDSANSATMRNMKIRFLSPTSITTSYGNEETLTITFTAVQSQ